MEGPKASDPRHGSLDPEVAALDSLLQVLADVMQADLAEEALDRLQVALGGQEKVNGRAVLVDGIVAIFVTLPREAWQRRHDGSRRRAAP